MLVTVDWIRENYLKYNELCWENKLPLNIEFFVTRGKKSWGYAGYRYDFLKNTIIPKKLSISNYYDSPEDVKISILLHEMIHIADYTFHPEHFIRNHRKVSRYSYDAHGYWFLKEAERVSKITKIKVSNHVTKEEQNASVFSENTIRLIEKKKNDALICAIVTGTCTWYTKTNKEMRNKLEETIKKRYNWTKFGGIISIDFYTFNNPKIAALRSRGRAFTGWKVSHEKFEQIKKDYEMKLVV